MSSAASHIFHQLHQSDTPLLLANAWDAASARLFQQQGAPAIATSSAALAWSLGYADGGALPRHELLAAIRRMCRVLHVPLSIDIENGYDESPNAVAALVQEIADCGVAGINLEDGAGEPSLLADKIRAIRQQLAGQPLFINARSDVLLRNLAEGDAAVAMIITRLQHYRTAGADGGFVPGLCATADVGRVAKAIDMPLNLMLLPGMASVAALAAAGARRFSTGPALFLAAYARAQQANLAWQEVDEQATLFDHALGYEAMNALMSDG